MHRLLRALGDWASQHPEDVLLLNIARTFRLGPEPPYLTVWQSQLERLEEWERFLKSSEANLFVPANLLSNRIDVAGCYTALLEPRVGRRGPYYAEFFELASPSTPLSDVAEFFDRRRGQHNDFTLHLLVHRIGKLAPDPGGICVWAVPDYRALETVASELDGVEDPVRLIRAGLYHDVGEEIL
jgi:hypothetical protein